MFVTKQFLFLMSLSGTMTACEMEVSSNLRIFIDVTVVSLGWGF